MKEHRVWTFRLKTLLRVAPLWCISDMLRRLFAAFDRYKPLCPATWPHWRGEPADGVEVLVQHLGYLPNEYKMGRWGRRFLQTTRQTGLKQRIIEHMFLLFPLCCSTKIFIRHPRTLYATEDAFEKCKHELGECKSAVRYQCSVFANWRVIWFYALNLQPRGSRPNTKDTNKRVNSKSRKKLVSAAT